MIIHEWDSCFTILTECWRHIYSLAKLCSDGTGRACAWESPVKDAVWSSWVLSLAASPFSTVISLYCNCICSSASLYWLDAFFSWFSSTGTWQACRLKTEFTKMPSTADQHNVELHVQQEFCIFWSNRKTRNNLIPLDLEIRKTLQLL